MIGTIEVMLGVALFALAFLFAGLLIGIEHGPRLRARRRRARRGGLIASPRPRQ